MAETSTTTRTRTRRPEPVPEDEEVKIVGSVSLEDDDDDDEEEEQPATSAAGGRASTRRSIPVDDDDDDDLDDDDDDDDSIVIGEGWDEAQAPTGYFPMVARGNYVVQLADVDKRKGQESGNTYAVCVFKIAADDNPSKMEEEDPTVTMWQNLFFTPKALGRTKKFVSDMGIAVRTGDNILSLLREESDAEARYDAIIGVERYRREDPETGKMKNAQRNRILRIIGPIDN